MLSSIRRFFPLFIVPTLFIVSAISVSSQRRPIIGSDSKRAERRESEREREREIRNARAKVSPEAVTRAQNGKTLVMPTLYLGESDRISSIAKGKPAKISKENGMYQENETEPLGEVPERSNLVTGPVARSFIQTEANTAPTMVQLTSFEGPGTGLSGFSLAGAPPDSTFAVGLDHIVAWTNSQYAIFDKSGNVLAGPLNGNSLFTGVGGLCETTNRGDPIVQYDRMADRWIMSQFAFNLSGGMPAAPYLQCVAVSTGGDPLGTYYRYSISFSSVSPSGFNDFGKIGIWNDAYYTSYNIFAGSPAGSGTGAALCASDRTAMLAGNAAATTLCAPITYYASGVSLLPADLDGSMPPTDTTRGGLFMRQTNSPALRYLRLKPDFNAGTVTITNGYGGAAGSYVSLALGSTTRPCNGMTVVCIAQPGTSNVLDTIGDRMMYRLAYRNRGGVDSLIVTQPVDPDGAGPRSSAVRWYEIRNPLANPADPDTTKRPYIYQQGTYDPGASGDRWLSSAAMDKHGNILVGYSMTDAANSIKPSIAIAGRTQSDTLNTFQAEQIAYTGTGSQTGTLTRWGDYSTMQVDPTDDETFWYIGEYLSTDGAFNWRTRLVSYKFQSTTATASGDLNAAGNWTNGTPSSTVTAVIPAGLTMSVNAPTTLSNLEVRSGGNLTLNADLDITGSLTLGTKVDTGSHTLGIGCQATVSALSSAAYVVGNMRKDYCATGQFTYPVGTAGGPSPVSVGITTLTTNPSSLTVRSVQAVHTGIWAASSVQRYWTLGMTGSLTANLTFNYLDGDVAGTESAFKLYKWEGSASTEVTPATLDTAANTMTATGISSFSDWTIGNLQPTAALASLAGRVMSADGTPIPYAVVTISDINGNTLSAIASPFGYYRFDNLPTGQTLTVTAGSKRSQFTPRLVDLNDTLLEIDLTAQ